MRLQEAYRGYEEDILELSEKMEYRLEIMTEKFIEDSKIQK